MASTTTFLGASNAVLRSVNQPDIESGDFASLAGTSNAREARMAKEIILEAYRELQNKRPDSYYQDAAELFLAERLQVSGNNTTDNPANGEGIVVINGAVGVQLYSDDLATSALSDASVIATDLLLRVSGDTQWYRMATLDTPTGAGTLVSEYLGTTTTAPTATVAGTAFEIVQFRTSTPANFRDTLNFYGPNMGVDVEHTSVDRLIEAISANSVLVSGSFPEEYAIGYDESSTPVRKIYWYPYLSQTRRMTLRYLRQQTVPSAAGDVFDMEEDNIPELLNRARAQAAIEIMGGERGFALAQYFKGMEVEKRGDANMKQSERARSQRLIPATGEEYRLHYQEGTALDRVRKRIFLRR
jgi:hypothetical protein